MAQQQKIFSRDFVLCFFAQFVFSMVFCILIPAIPIYLSRFEARAAEIGFRQDRFGSRYSNLQHSVVKAGIYFVDLHAFGKCEVAFEFSIVVLINS